MAGSFNKKLALFILALGTVLCILLWYGLDSIEFTRSREPESRFTRDRFGRIQPPDYFPAAAPRPSGRGRGRSLQEDHQVPVSSNNQSSMEKTR